MRAAGERLDVQRLRVLPVDPVADAAQPGEVAEVLWRNRSAGHPRDRATSRRGVTSHEEHRPRRTAFQAALPRRSRSLLNLIDNAIRHTPAGGSVIVRAVVHPGGVQIQVNDTGPGLCADTRADPLEARGRSIPPVRPGRRGLVIARTIVEAHGGGLWAGSAARGASVRFYLPATVRTGA